MSGCAGLWCRLDTAQNVEQHIVVKEARPRIPEWRDPVFWRVQLPKEIRIHKLINENRPEVAVPGYMNIIRHHGYRLMMAQRRFRLYLDYCEGGT
jgi:hypothetical protein